MRRRIEVFSTVPEDSLIPIWVEGPLDDTGSVDLLPVHRDDGERVGKPEDIALDERVGGDDCVAGDEVREPGLISQV
jgi:hypothetical protein